MGRSPIPRIVDETDLAGFTTGQFLDVIEAVTMILSLPRAATDRVDALAVVIGQGEEWRLVDAIRIWEATPALRHFLVANGNPAERTYLDLNLDYLRGLGLRRLAGIRLQEEPGPNTGVQAEWLASQVRLLDIASLALTVSPYHLPRAYLTVLKAFSRFGLRLPVLPIPVAVAPDTPVPETGAAGYDLVAGEVSRMVRYAESGWLANPGELRDYLRWLWNQHGDLLGCAASPTDR